MTTVLACSELDGDLRYVNACAQCNSRMRSGIGFSYRLPDTHTCNADWAANRPV
ncbi:hypothetical protein CYLTODRAFT_427098 [Cylindrobasidium torrendii FP15055 ss-10]|uniref:Uncharacterized protein n=1 Tax=Cylindrobasidium torrendii FP15055 ss-10 TaxID=1314674 RepID=A0A0D7AWH2_9AGAR|nr:hypothetical protein CYLTODRAFT_427098 [Cylindrobasidium torrendii FP15055 ss-10]